MSNEITARDEALSLYSDLYKDCYGFRPRFAWMAEATAEDFYREIDDLPSWKECAHDNGDILPTEGTGWAFVPAFDPEGAGQRLGDDYWEGYR
jgi:hypothetical protein